MDEGGRQGRKWFGFVSTIMGHGRCTFKKRDVKTALDAARESGVDIARIEIDKDGKIIIIAGRAVEGDIAAAPSEWD